MRLHDWKTSFCVALRNITCVFVQLIVSTISFISILMISGQSCACHPSAITEIVYDSSFRHPICRSTNCSSSAPICITKSTFPAQCPVLYLREVVNSVQPFKFVQIVESAVATARENISRAKCDRSVAACAEPKYYQRFDDYCIPQSLLKDYQSYRLFQMPLPTVIDIYANLDFLVFFCQAVRLNVYCEHIANLCVLSKYVWFSISHNS